MLLNPHTQMAVLRLPLCLVLLTLALDLLPPAEACFTCNTSGRRKREAATGLLGIDQLIISDRSSLLSSLSSKPQYPQESLKSATACVANNSTQHFFNCRSECTHVVRCPCCHMNMLRPPGVSISSGAGGGDCVCSL